MFERLKELHSRIKALAEIDNLSESDLTDLGLNRDQMRMLVAIPRDVGDRVAAMARLFGVDPAGLQADRSEFVDVLAKCSQCQVLGQCAHELAKGDAADPENCGFCVNAATFADHAAHSHG